MISLFLTIEKSFHLQPLEYAQLYMVQGTVKALRQPECSKPAGIPNEKVGDTRRLA